MLKAILNDLGCDFYGPLPTADQAVAVVASVTRDAAFITLCLTDKNAKRLAEMLVSRNVRIALNR